MEFNKTDGTVRWVDRTVKVTKQTRRTGVLRRQIPRTKEHRKRSRKCLEFGWFLVWTNKWIVENCGNTVARYWRDVIPRDLLLTLAQSTLTLKNLYKPPKGKQTRSEEWVYHFGVWCKYMKFPKATSQTNNRHVKRWLRTNRPLIKFIAELFQKEFPRLYKQYTQVMNEFPKLPNYFGPWTTCALNVNFPSSYHQDTKDYRNGLCWVLPFGDFTEGGELIFDDMKLVFDMQNGSLIAFRSYDVFHSVRKYSGGYRNSLVLFTHHDMFTKGMKQRNRRIRRELQLAKEQDQSCSTEMVK